MKTIKKIGFSIVIIILSMITMAIVSETGNNHSSGIRLIPGFILVVGLIYIWTRKSKNHEDNS